MATEHFIAYGLIGLTLLFTTYFCFLYLAREKEIKRFKKGLKSKEKKD